MCPNRWMLTMKCSILIIFATISGVWSGSFSVTFGQSQCVLRGATVVIDCKYDYPFAHFVTSVSWLKAQYISGYWRLVPLEIHQNPPGHFQYLGNKQGNCRLQINDVQLVDEGKYYFNFQTTLGWYTSYASLQLSVKELTAVVERSTVVEGDAVKLACLSGCGAPVDIVWSREGRPATQAFRAKRGDAGRYHCAVWEQERVRSAPVALNVLYRPERVTLSISPGGAVVMGSTVTFSCSSDARPPVEDGGYSLYWEDHFLGLGQSLAIQDVRPEQSGRYHCRAWNNVSSGGTDLFLSPALPLQVYYPPVNVSVQVDPALVMWGGGVNLSCSGTADPPVDTYAWYRRTNGSGLLVGSGRVLSILSMDRSLSGLYFCQAGNRVGRRNSSEVLLSMVEQEEERGSPTLQAVAGIGLSLLVALVLALFVLWRKKRNLTGENEAEGDPSEKGPDANLYANIGLGPPLPDFAFHAQQPSDPEQDSPTSAVSEVTYSTVNIRSRGLNGSTDVDRSQPKEENSSDHTIYATVKGS